MLRDVLPPQDDDDTVQEGASDFVDAGFLDAAMAADSAPAPVEHQYEGGDDVSEEPQPQDDRGGTLALVDEDIERSVVTPDGYVTTPVAPWDIGRQVGRITCWPEGAPAIQQNVAVRCYMHAGCSFTRKRRKFDNTTLLRWLYCARPLPANASTESRAAAKEEHKADAARILANPQ